MKEALLVIDKPTGPTSFDMIRQVKHLFRGIKIGHTGSLDPFASGVLILLTGKATKLSNVLLTADKTYRATVQLGEATDTQDCTGQVTERVAVPPIDKANIERVLKGFEGEWLQTPPMYSAKKVKGVRLYELARKNINIQRQQVPVQLYRLELKDFSLPRFTFEVHCSKGTYIRSLADEIGRRLGTVGHLAELTRLSCGAFKLEEAITIEKLEQQHAACLEKGYQNYVRLVRTEGLLPKGPPRMSGLTHSHLQMTGNSGNSLLN